jgi:hypothetical protein
MIGELMVMSIGKAPHTAGLRGEPANCQQNKRRHSDSDREHALTSLSTARETEEHGCDKSVLSDSAAAQKGTFWGVPFWHPGIHIQGRQ